MSMENNIPKVTVGRFVKEMSQLYTTVLHGGWSLSMVPSPFVWGPPGVGKSEGIRQIAGNIHSSTGKNVAVTDIRLSMFSPIDLRGVPVADAQKEFTVWLKPKIFELDDSKETVNILFFDELSSAPQQVQAAAYQITLDHRIGEHVLPDNCIIVGAGNRTIDRSVVFRMPGALANRLQHYEIAADYDAWKSWAVKNHVHPYVLGYLAFDSSRLCQEDVPAEQIPFPTPRTWVFVSNLLWIMDGVKSAEDMYAQIGACVGADTAVSFLAWIKKRRDLPSVEDVFRGKYVKYPSSPDVLFALVESLISYIGNRERRGDSMSLAELNNMAMYAARFPSDYQAALYFNLEKDTHLTERLKKVKLYREYKRRNEGIV